MQSNIWIKTSINTKASSTSEQPPWLECLSLAVPHLLACLLEFLLSGGISSFCLHKPLITNNSSFCLHNIFARTNQEEEKKIVNVCRKPKRNRVILFHKMTMISSPSEMVIVYSYTQFAFSLLIKILGSYSENYLEEYICLLAVDLSERHQQSHLQ